MRSAEATIRRLPLFSGLSFTPIMVPVLVLFWEENGLSTFDIYLLQSAFAVAVVALEVPTGMLADRVGKRASLLAGQVIIALGSVAYALSGGFWSFLASEIVLALGMSLLSGADAALLYDCLKRLGREGEFSAYEGRNHSIRLLVFAACSVLGGVIGPWSLRATLWASAVGPALAVLLALTFAEAAPPPRDKGWREAAAGYRGLIRGSLRFVTRHRLVRWIISFQAVLLGSATWLLWLYQPYMALGGLPLWAFGFAFAAFNLFASASSRFAHRVGAALGEGGVLVALALLQTLPLLLMAAFIGPLSFLFILGVQANRGLGRPLLHARILAYTYADKRATVLSLANLSGRLFFALTGPLIGLAGERLTIPGNLLVQAALLALIFGLLAWRYRRIPAKYFQVKPAPAEG